MELAEINELILASFASQTYCYWLNYKISIEVALLRIGSSLDCFYKKNIFNSNKKVL